MGDRVGQAHALATIVKARLARVLCRCSKGRRLRKINLCRWSPIQRRKNDLNNQGQMKEKNLWKRKCQGWLKMQQEPKRLRETWSKMQERKECNNRKLSWQISGNRI